MSTLILTSFTDSGSYWPDQEAVGPLSLPEVREREIIEILD